MLSVELICTLELLTEIYEEVLRVEFVVELLVWF